MFTTNDVMEAIRSTKNSKAFGRTSIDSPESLETQYLTTLMNIYISSLEIPGSCKLSKIIPILKPTSDLVAVKEHLNTTTKAPTWVQEDAYSTTTMIIK